jgi:hypothetical protein
MTRIHSLHRDERGLSFVIVSIGITAFVAATTLAVDVGMLLTARSQAQNSADAGALAGATALAFNDFNDHSSSGPAVRGAINAALANKVVGQPVSIGSSDVTFPVAPSGSSDRVQVTVYRTGERGSAVSTMIAGLFGVTSVNIVATATAEAVLANSESCVKPWALPDRWTEKQTPGWDVTDTFNAFTGNPSVLPDIFRQVTQATYTGYGPGQIGQAMQIAKDDAFTLEGDRFLSIRMPGSLGDDDFLSNIEHCAGGTMTIGDSMTIEGGATAQHIIDGANYLIGLDPSASWNTATHTVASSINPSPRVLVLPLYEPLFFQQGVRTGNFTQVRISNFIGFFVDHVEASKVVGYVMPTLGTAPTNGTAAPVGAFARAIRLVQ